MFSSPLSSLSIFLVYGAEHVSFIKGLVIPALQAQTFPGTIALAAVNYQSQEALLEDVGRDRVEVRDISLSRPEGRMGFGDGMNFLFEQLNPKPYVMLLNPDAVPHPHCLEYLLATMLGQPKAGIVEARQWPNAHPKEYDETTGETPWACFAGALVHSGLWKEIGGFDPLYFLYCEDVDFSWRTWLAGRRVLLEPEAVITHWTGLFHYREDRFYLEHFYNLRNCLLLGYKFFGEDGEKRARRMIASIPQPKALIAQATAAYERIRPQVTPLLQPVKHPKIKFLGCARYHELREYEL